MLYLLLINCITTLCLLFFFLRKNQKVYKFRMNILDIIENESKKDTYYSVAKQMRTYHYLPDFLEMVLSFKKLTLENYLTEEQIKELLNQK